MIYRNAPRIKFTQIPNSTLLDPNLSWKAKGILAAMLSRPDDWVFYESELLSHATDGRDALRSGIKELEEAGYLVKEQVRGEDGKFTSNVMVVYEISQKVAVDEKYTEDGFSVDGKSVDGFPDTTNTYSTKTDVNKEEHMSDLQSDDTPSASKDDTPSLQKFVDTYNQHRGSLPKVTTLSKSRQRKIRAVYREFGEDKALQLIENATKQVAKDAWWVKKLYNLDNLLNGTHLVSKADIYLASRKQSEDAPF